MSHVIVNAIGYGSDIAGAHPGSAEGPITLKNSPLFAAFPSMGITLDWQTIVQPDLTLPSKLGTVQRLCEELSLLTVNSVLQQQFFVVFGGDHTSAIGTWSGVSHAKRQAGPIGLIWVDAHLDSHTPQTSETGNLHGMPLACLLGFGESRLTQILRQEPKIQPENVCLIGIRSFEEGELQLLKRLNVRIFFMDEVKKRGIKNVMQDAIQHVTQHTSCYGITIDIDSIDPKDAPGTGVAEPDGIPGADLCEGLTQLANDPRLIGVEIAEFDPKRDKDNITVSLIINLLQAVLLGKKT